VDDSSIKAAPGRIQENRCGLIKQSAQSLSHISHIKRAAGSELIVSSILTGKVDGTGMVFDAVDSPSCGGHRQTVGSDAAVAVDQQSTHAWTKGISDQIDNPLRLDGVHLEECISCNLKCEIRKMLGNRTSTCNNLGLRSEQCIVVAGLNVEADTYHPGPALHPGLSEVFQSIQY